MPPVGDVLRRICADDPLASEGAALVGRVLDASGRPLAGATVRATWSGYVRPGGGSDGVLFRDVTELETTTETDGIYRLCGVRRGERVEVVTIVDGVERPGGVVTIGLDDAGELLEIRRRDESRDAR